MAVVPLAAMVKPRKFTGAEWRDLARGCRWLVKQDEDGFERNKHTTAAGTFEASKRLHLEMVELCEYWAQEAERAGRS